MTSGWQNATITYHADTSKWEIPKDKKNTKKPETYLKVLDPSGNSSQK